MLGDTLVTGSTTVVIKAMSVSPYAVNELWPESGYSSFKLVSGSLTFTANGWALADGSTALGVRASVIAGKPSTLAKLGVMVRDEKGQEDSVVASLFSAKRHVVIWLFQGNAQKSPLTLVFPDGKTVRLDRSQ